MAKVSKILTSRKKPITEAADKVSTIIHSCRSAEHLQAADKAVTAFRKLYTLHSCCLNHTQNLCAELQLKRIVINHLQCTTA